MGMTTKAEFIARCSGNGWSNDFGAYLADALGLTDEPPPAAHDDECRRDLEQLTAERDEAIRKRGDWMRIADEWREKAARDAERAEKMATERDIALEELAATREAHEQTNDELTRFERTHAALIAAAVAAEREALLAEVDAMLKKKRIRARSAPAPVASEQPGIAQDAYAASLRATARAGHDGIYTPMEQPAPAPQPAVATDDHEAYEEEGTGELAYRRKQPAAEPSDEELGLVAWEAFSGANAHRAMAKWEQLNVMGRTGWVDAARALRARLARPVVVTDEMVERAVKAFWAEGTIRAALEAALGAPR